MRKEVEKLKVINIKGTIIPKQNKWIYDWLEYPYTTADDVLKVLSDANGEDIEVHINSYGGSVYDSYEIYTALRGYKGNVLIKIVGLAVSAASFIAMARKCLMSPLAELMIHNASMNASGPHQVMDSASEKLQITDSTIAKAYCIKSGKSEEEIRALMEKETWFTAEQAKELGLIDGIMFEDDNGTKNIVPMLYNSLPIPNVKAIEELEKCGSIEELKKKLKASIDQPIVENTIVDNKMKEDEGMTKEELKNKFPETYDAIFNEGASTERNRIKAISEMKVPKDHKEVQDILNKAMFESGDSVEKVSSELISSGVLMKVSMLDARKKDADESGVNDLPADHAPDSKEETNAKVQKEAEELANTVNRKRGVQ